MEWAIVAVLVVLNMVLTVFIASRLVAVLHGLIDDLDGRLAEAIRSVMEGSSSLEFEPVNPVQAAIAQFITTRLSERPIEAVITERGLDGKFVKDI